MYVFEEVLCKRVVCILILAFIRVYGLGQTDKIADSKGLFFRHNVQLFGSSIYKAYLSPTYDSAIAIPRSLDFLVGLQWGRKQHDFRIFMGRQSKISGLEYNSMPSNDYQKLIMTKISTQYGLGYSRILFRAEKSNLSFEFIARQEFARKLIRQTNWINGTQKDYGHMKPILTWSIGIKYQKNIGDRFGLYGRIFGEYYHGDTTDYNVWQSYTVYYTETYMVGIELGVLVNLKKHRISVEDVE